MEGYTDVPWTDVPWKAEWYHNAVRWQVRRGNGDLIAVTYGTQEKQIAYFIAAAPETLRQRDELLAALESMVEGYETGTWLELQMGMAIKRIEVARAAIAKARGEAHAH